ncbi:hypothetical protein NCS57_00669200 [Fusarium keratoplasticum]|uniref:Uncharacterized protein n=1 Tax=Fusarium keratoplasticum TaxID=1328300 RepID=A0ACC0QY31_9HYPO|nr:hypothetical protein NCS57_00669200 [Fusarium keratoplasticum]KAI8668577.1 hypothetical protein NCS57_00669200 [Fusarium keratoplasticum]KAI8673207.1 hypothetical protein NCS55_00639800 [Fusarium keratoplasticum]
MTSWRQGELGKRPVRIANCSGYCGDPAEEMMKQATLGDIDFITGDYLAEVNLAANAEAFANGKHPGYEVSALEGLKMTLDVINTKRIKVALNGGALNPKGLAEAVAELVKERNATLTVAYISGDDVLPEVRQRIQVAESSQLPHLDSVGNSVRVEQGMMPPAEMNPDAIVSANAYLGARGIVAAFRNGADIVIAGRVSDASPVIAAAWYWWSWSDTNYDQLAGGLVAGHLIECSAYVTGGNYAGFTEAKYGGWQNFTHPGFPIAEVDADGSCVITKHPGTGGFVDEDTVKCQLLYELQGSVYLHSDSKAVLDEVTVRQVGPDRVRVSGIRGLPPPPSTKVAIFYKGGYESQLLLNTAGYDWEAKCDLLEKQVRLQLGDKANDLDILQFQRVGVPADNPRTQNSSTMYIRIIAHSKDSKSLMLIPKAISDISLKHFHGFHCSLDMRTAFPKPFLAYYPALWDQSAIRERVTFINNAVSSSIHRPVDAGIPPIFGPLSSRDSYDTASPVPLTGPKRKIKLGDVALARSGDKGGNLNVGIFVRTQRQWDWLRTYLSREQMWSLLGDDANDSYTIERVEFGHIFAVHFVIYGILGRGVSSSTRLDAFGKGFADYLRDKIVEVPEELVE